jgi:hypothetical protein
MKNARKILTTLLLLGIIVTMSGQSRKAAVTKSKTFRSEGAADGYITNSRSKTVSDYFGGSQGKEILIGWNNNGQTMRGFVSFDVSGILPPEGSKMVIDKAVLSIYQANWNKSPFNKSGERTIECYLMEYKDLDGSDFNAQTIANCGVIAANYGDVLNEFPLNVTASLNNYISNSTNKVQFRLQFTSDDNVGKSGDLAGADWDIFSGDQELMAGNDFRPKLTIKYHYQKK